MTSYHNTTNLAGRPLVRAEGKATRQDELILAFLRHEVGNLYTASEVHRLLEKSLKGAPLTSTRRALTNLTNRPADEPGAVKTDVTRTSPYGRPESCYTYRPPVTETGTPAVQTTLF